jgi:hypothetical protein
MAEITMDKITKDNPDGSQSLPEGATVVRRVEITVEREITTVILRRKVEASEPEPPAGTPES